MKRTILAIGKVITFLGIAMYCGFMAYVVAEGDDEMHLTDDNSHTIILSEPMPTWIALAPIVTLSAGAILWSIGQRSRRASS